ncbi:MAG: rhomboid family intramembrane serine protease [Atopobiaceae bacterium]|nr:rhomboid family intramembrane serine protease [Atopobiaceae bacterium]
MQLQNRKLPKITFNAPVTLCFVFACVAVQIASTLTGGASTALLFTSRPGSLANPLTYFCLVSHIFGHAGWDHLFANMGYILILGPLLEEKYGSLELAGIMLASALASSLANIFFLHSGVLGASGVVFTFILLSSFTGLREGEIPLTFILVTLFYLTQQLYGALFVGGNISYLGHIAGGVVGAIVGFVLPAQNTKPTSGYGMF